MYRVQSKISPNHKPITHNQRAFTLIELMITIAIIGILFGVVITAANSVRKNSHDAQRKGDLGRIQSALQNYYGDQTTFPTSLTPGSPLTAGSVTYLNNVPSDPLQGNPNYCYVPYISNGGSSCSAPPCLYYQLYAKLENPTGSTYPGQCGSTYNYMVTPP